MNRRSLGDLSSTLTLWEQSHRRAVLYAVVSLLVLSTSPVFAHHLALGVHSLLGGVDHLGAFCLTALHLLLAPVHYAFHVVLGLGLAYAVWDRWRAWRSGVRALAPLDAVVPAPGDPFWQAAEEAGIDPGRIRLVHGLPCPALTIGTLRPLIYVARELVVELTPDELASVLAHEGAHLVRRDPLRLSLLRFLACTFFWMPALRRLADDMADEAEILADDRAARGRPLVLATAILALARWPSAGRVADDSVAFVDSSGPDLLDRRIRRLAGELVGARSHVTRRSMAGALAALSLAWTSGLLMVHPLPAPVASELSAHCEHRAESAVRHLFCLGEPLTRLAPECPHDTGRAPLDLHA